MDAKISLIFDIESIVRKLCTSLFSDTNEDGRLAAILFPKFMLKHTS